jgi:hypothetical protein
MNPRSGIWIFGVTLVLIGNSARADIAWMRASDGQVPADAMLAGKEASGEPLYVCRAEHNEGIHPGKLREAFRGCNISWGGREYTKSSYEVLVDERTR